MTYLFINSIAGSEIIVILLFVLIFFGAKSIPGMARTLGRGLRHIRDASQEVQNEIKKTTGDMRSEMSMKRRLDQLAEDVSNPIKSVTRAVEEQASRVEKETGLKGSIPQAKVTSVQLNTASEKEKSSGGDNSANQESINTETNTQKVDSPKKLDD